MLTVGFVISILIQVVLPIALGYFLIRRYTSEWKIFGVGALAYLMAQVVQSPTFQAISGSEFYQTALTSWSPTVVILVFAFLSVLLENLARFGGFWFIREKGKAWGSALVMGAGHGGVESLLVGFQFLINFIFAISITTGGTESLQVSPEEAAVLSRQVEAFWALPWYLPLATALQRLSALSLQLTVSTLMWVAVSRRIWIFALAALLWHTALNSVAATISYSMPDAWNSLMLAGLILVNIAIILLVYRKAKETGPMEAPVQAAVATRGLKYLEQERKADEAPKQTTENYKEIIEAKRAKQRQMRGGEEGKEE